MPLSNGVFFMDASFKRSVLQSDDNGKISDLSTILQTVNSGLFIIPIVVVILVLKGKNSVHTIFKCIRTGVGFDFSLDTNLFERNKE